MSDWSRILAEHGPAVWRTVYRLLDQHADASDAYQETFLTAWQYAERRPVAGKDPVRRQTFRHGSRLALG